MLRPLSQALLVDMRDEVFHFNYLFLGDGEDNQKYVFVLTDDLMNKLGLMQQKPARQSTQEKCYLNGSEHSQCSFTGSLTRAPLHKWANELHGRSFQHQTQADSCVLIVVYRNGRLS